MPNVSLLVRDASSQIPRRLLTALLFVAIAAAMRFYHLENQSLWNDEMFSMEVASSDVSQIQSKLIASYHHPPLYFYILHVVFKLFGENTWALRCISALSGALTVGVIYYYTARVFTNWAGVIAGMTCLVAPFHIAYSQEGRPYMFAALLCIVSCYFLLRVIQEDTLRWKILYVLDSAALLYTHHWGIFVLVAQAIFILLFSGSSRPRKVSFAVLWAVIALCYLPELFALTQQVSAGGQEKWWWVEQPTVSEVVNIFGAFSGTYFKMAASVFDLPPVMRAVGEIAVFALCLSAVVLAVQRTSSVALRSSLMCFLGTLAIPFLLSFIKPEIFNWYRHTIIVFPLFCVCIGGIVAHGRWRFLNVTCAGILIVVAFFGVIKYSSWSKSNVKEVARYVEQVTQGNTKLLIRPSYFAPLLNYYYRGDAVQFDESYLDQPLGGIVDTAATFVYVSLDIPNEIREYMDWHFDKVSELRFPGEAHMGIIVGVYRQKPEAEDKDSM